MSVSVQQILGFLRAVAPQELALDWDNVGLLVDEAIEHNKQHPKTYTAEEVKAEMRRRAEEKLAGHDL